MLLISSTNHQWERSPLMKVSLYKMIIKFIILNKKTCAKIGTGEQDENENKMAIQPKENPGNMV